MTEERWLPVVGYEGLYEVSDQGRVRSLDRVINRRDGRTMKLRGVMLRVRHATKRGGYPFVTLSRNGHEWPHTIHVLMLTAFVGPRPEGDTHGRHLNDVATDNRLTNLAWGTHKENFADMLRNGNHFNGNKTHCPQGHEYTPENTAINKAGRACRECHRIRGRERYRRNAATISKPAR